MTHEEAISMVPALFGGRAPEAARKEIEAHLAGCDECRSLAGTYRLIAETIRAEGTEGPAGHPSSRAIVALAADPHSLESSRKREIANHLEGCLECAAEADLTRRAHKATESRSLRPAAPFRRLDPRGWSAPLQASLAASVVAAALAYPVYRGTGRLSEARIEVDRLRSAGEADRRARDELQASLGSMQDRLRRIESWTGPVDLRVLDGSSRSGSPDSVLRIAPGQPFAAIGVLPPSPSPGGDRGDSIFTIDPVDSPGLRQGWSSVLTSVEIQRQLDSSGVITFLIPADLLPPGRYLLRVRGKSDPRAADRLRVPFEVAGE